VSIPLKTQFREYFAYVDDRQGAVDISLLTERLELEEGDLIMVDIQTRETDTHRQDDETGRSWPFYAVAAAAAVVIVILAITLFDGTEESSELDTVDSPVDIGQQFDSTWVATNRLPLYLGSLAIADERAVVVGMGPDDTLLAFYSDDVYQWEPAVGLTEVVADDGTIGFEWEPGVGLAEMKATPFIELAAGPQGFVAVSFAEEAWPTEPLVAFSPDGVSWEQLVPAELPDADVGMLYDVVAGPDGYVIVGVSKIGPDYQALLWFSEDGRNWVTTNLPSVDYPLDVTSNGSVWMALGGRDDADLSRVFTSSDGVRWIEVDTQNPPPTDAVMEYIGAAPFASDDDAWVLIPGESPTLPNAWVSTDNGQSWNEMVISDDQAVDRPTDILDIVVTDHAFLVAGTQDTRTEHSAPVLLFSSDATDWELYSAVTDYWSVATLGHDIIALDSEGGMYLWSGT
jgi:hypothetical protein